MKKLCVLHISVILSIIIALIAFIMLWTPEVKAADRRQNPYRSEQVQERLQRILKNGNINNALEIIYKIAGSGVSVIDILYEFTVYIKRENKILNDTDKYEIITLVSKYITIFHDVHEDIIEMAFLTNDIMSYIGDKNNNKNDNYDNIMNI